MAGIKTMGVRRRVESTSTPLHNLGTVVVVAGMSTRGTAIGAPRPRRRFRIRIRLPAEIRKPRIWIALFVFRTRRTWLSIAGIRRAEGVRRVCSVVQFAGNRSPHGYGFTKAQVELRLVSLVASECWDLFQFSGGTSETSLQSLREESR